MKAVCLPNRVQVQLRRRTRVVGDGAARQVAASFASRPKLSAKTTRRGRANLPRMEMASIISTLRRHEAELWARGGSRRGFLRFSRAGGQPRRQRHRRRRGSPVWQYSGLKAFIGELFDAPVDVVNRAGLKPQARPAVDEVHGF